jgi:hypothetical protein
MGSCQGGLSILGFIYSIYLFAVFIYKWATDGAESYFEHYTDWSWTFQNIFFFLVSFSSCGQASPYCDRVVSRTICCCYFPLLGTVTAIFVGVIVFLLTDDVFLVDLFDEYAEGLVVVGNTLVHTIPFIALIFYTFLQWPRIYTSINDALRGADEAEPRDSAGRVALIGYWLFSATALFGIYLGVLEIWGKSLQTVYMVTHVTPILAVVGVLTISVCTVSSYLYVLFTEYGLRSDARVYENYIRSQQFRTDYQVLMGLH